MIFTKFQHKITAMYQKTGWIIFFVVLLFAVNNLAAQVNPPAVYSAAVKVNYIKTWEAKAPVQSLTDLQSRPVSDVSQSTVYFDGFGRKMESVDKQMSPLKNDLVQAFVYDPSTGREIYHYLPFTSNNTQSGDIVNDGNFKLDPIQQQVAFYNSTMSATGQSGEYNTGPKLLNWGYSQAVFENATLNRVTATYPPGSNWVGATRGAGKVYSINKAVDNVQVWYIHAGRGSIPYNLGTYADGQLSKFIETDANGIQTIQFKDKDGHVILQKVQLSAASDNGTGSDHMGWLCTYYVYDDYDNLRFIITPNAINQIYTQGAGWTSISQTIADELCYRFEYDLFNRVIVKKTPGTPSGAGGEIWTVYDQRNRPVMQQDGNLRAKQQWEYIQYDALDRPTVTGIITDASNYNNLDYHTGLAANSITYPNPANYTNELLSQTHYDDYSNMNTANTSSLSTSMDASSAGSGNSNFAATNNSAPLYSQPVTQSPLTRGLVTWTKEEVIGQGLNPNSTYLYSVSFYDNKGRVIQTQSINITGGEDINTVQYDFSGKALTNVLTHTAVGTNGNQTHTSVDKMSYDHAGRLLTVTRSLSSVINSISVSTNAPIMITSDTYNELGQLQQKKLGQQRDANNNPVSAPMETLSYDYTLQGALLGINRNYLSPGYSAPAGGSNFFGMELSYDKQTSVTGHNYAAVQYNGNFTGQSWKTAGDGIDRQYNYVYDNAKRMTGASFVQNSSGSTWDNGFVDFSVSGITYDYNGNLLGKNQTGFRVGGAGAIDQLTYTYFPASNRLQNVIDGVNNPASHLGDFISSQTYMTSLGNSKTVANAAAYTDYGYDANGNVTKDLNKDIGTSSSVGIVYNYLNLPMSVTFANKGTIQFVYDAAGNKLSKTITENNATVSYNGTNYTTNATTTFNYINGFVYKNIAYNNAALAPLQLSNVLQYQNNEEGRIRFIPAVGNIPAFFVYDYFIRDHLNNVRMTLTDEKQLDIYPAATLETTAYNGGTPENLESLYYTINVNNIKQTSSLAWWGNVAGNSYANNNGTPSNPDPYTPSSSTSANVYWLNGQTSDKSGLGITLKVMAGDQISIYGKSVWHGSALPIDNSYLLSNTVALNTFLSFFTGTPVINNLTHQTLSAAALSGTPATATPLTGLLNGYNTNNAGAGQPVKAGVNWILFDDQFRPVQSGSGFDPVSSSPDVIKNVGSGAVNTTNISMPQNGYLYVYCSNESNMDVYFDNLQVTQNRGPILEETHLYPDGLMMAGISDKAWNKLENGCHYQSKEMQNEEWSDGSGLELYDFGARMYDPQLGVWHNQDPAGQFSSPYMAMGNNWPNGTDPTGKLFGFDDLIVSAIGFAVGYVGYGLETHHWGGKALLSGLADAAIAEGGYLGLGGGYSATQAATEASEAGTGFTTNILSESLVTGGKGLMSSALSYSAVYATADATSLLQNSDQLHQDSWTTVGLMAGYAGLSALQAGFQSSSTQGAINKLFNIKNDAIFAGAFSNGIGGGIAGVGNTLLGAYDPSTKSWGHVNLNDLAMAGYSGFASNAVGQAAHNASGDLLNKNWFSKNGLIGLFNGITNSAGAISQQIFNNIYGNANLFSGIVSVPTLLGAAGGWPGDMLSPDN